MFLLNAFSPNWNIRLAAEKRVIEVDRTIGKEGKVRSSMVGGRLGGRLEEEKMEVVGSKKDTVAGRNGLGAKDEENDLKGFGAGGGGFAG